MHRSSLCPSCGKPTEDCLSMEGVGPDFAVEHAACRATMARLAYQRAQFGDGKTPDPNAPAYLYSIMTRR